MRPIARGARGAYPYNIDVSSMVNLTNTLGNYTLFFLAVAVVNATANGNNPTMWNLLNDILLTLVRVGTGEIVAPGNLATLAAGKKTVNSRIADEYRKSANPLITNTGIFCSYCERPNPSPVAVEHMVPKANYPLFVIAWANLLLACTACNTGGTGKGSLPTRATVTLWNGGAPADDLAFYTLVKGHYLWPDEQLAYRNLYPRLEYQSQTTGNWTPVANADSVSYGIFITALDFTQRQVTASIYLDNTNHLYTRNVRVVMVPADATATASSAFYGLDRPGTAVGPDPAVTDSRMYDRTRAWFSIVNILGEGYRKSNSKWPDWWNLVLHNELATIGYFSLWVRIMQLRNDYTPGPLVQTVLTRFLNQCVASFAFPGTDTTQVP